LSIVDVLDHVGPCMAKVADEISTQRRRHRPVTLQRVNLPLQIC
jgi:hypothetical protein